jgi:hypothetical protein
MCRIVLALAAAAFAPSAAHAQIAIYGQATGASLQFPNTHHMYGGSFGFYDTKAVGPLALGADFRGSLTSRGSSDGPYFNQALDSGQLGVRIAAAPGALPLKGLMPYVEGTGGVGFWRGGIGVTRQDATHSLVQVAAGIDYAITHRIRWRVGEFTYGRAGAQPGRIHPETVSSGIVLQLPDHPFHQTQ